MIKSMTQFDAITYIALAALLHDDPEKVRGVVRVCLERLPMDQHGLIPLILQGRDPRASIKVLMENVVAVD